MARKFKSLDLSKTSSRIPSCLESFFDRNILFIVKKRETILKNVRNSTVIFYRHSIGIIGANIFKAD